MGLSYSTDKTDTTGKEMLTYGTPDFPIAFFSSPLFSYLRLVEKRKASKKQYIDICQIGYYI